MESEVKINSMLNSSEFVKEIERIVADAGADYIDAVVDYCTKRGIEVETAAAIIRKSELLKSKIQREAEDLNILPKTARLPV